MAAAGMVVAGILGCFVQRIEIVDYHEHGARLDRFNTVGTS